MITLSQEWILCSTGGLHVAQSNNKKPGTQILFINWKHVDHLVRKWANTRETVTRKSRKKTNNRANNLDNGDSRTQN